jgi:hypothetical protein
MEQKSRDVAGEFWENDAYTAVVVRDRHELSIPSIVADVPGMRMTVVRIGISNNDQTARHDWRDLQRIKNDIVGPEWEAVELYPAESRLVDPSNYFLLWAIPPGMLRLGIYVGRNVCGPKDAIAPQRGFWAGAVDCWPGPNK